MVDTVSAREEITGAAIVIAVDEPSKGTLVELWNADDEIVGSRRITGTAERHLLLYLLNLTEQQ